MIFCLLCRKVYIVDKRVYYELSRQNKGIKMRIFGYARASTKEQENSIKIQKENLLKAGVEEKRIFCELKSGKQSDSREKLQLVLLKMEDGDKLIVNKIDRLARNTLDLLSIMQDLKERGIAVEFLQERIDTSTAMGELCLTLLGAVAEMERKTILERTAAGRQHAKSKGVKFGRKIILNHEQIILDYQEGDSIKTLCSKHKMSKAALYKILKQNNIEKKRL